MVVGGEGGTAQKDEWFVVEPLSLSLSAERMLKDLTR